MLSARHAKKANRENRLCAQEGLRAMDFVQNIAILVVGATSFWAFITLRKRIEFLEHEVRWLRSEFNDIKLVDSDRQSR
jgi:hypothetical protein